MKCITLTQPWATLVAIGAKRIETRSWSTSYRGPLAIHAGKGPGSLGWMQMQHLCRHTEPFKTVLGLGDRHPGSVLPFGAIVATCELVSCVEIDGKPTGFAVHGRTPDQQLMWWLTVDEYAFGDYTSGRYAWLLADIKPLIDPIPAKGALSIWEWQP